MPPRDTADLLPAEPTPKRTAELTRERHRMLRGLLLLAALVLIASIARAGLARVFYSHWWRQW